jgi:hypothetical protein
MIPGADRVVACPSCKRLAKYSTLVSGNTCGARVWTDGRQIAPMLPLPPAVVRCRYCSVCYWLADTEELGTVATWDSEAKPQPPEWIFAEYVEEPDERDYYKTIRDGLAADREQERALRILAWWRSNDCFRHLDGGDKPELRPDSTERDANIRALLELLHPSEMGDRLLSAEVYRELGMFSAAKEVLEGISTTNLAAGPHRRRWTSIVKT